MERLTYTPNTSADEVISIARAAARTLAAGGVVAFPTETVYGFAIRAADHDALDKLLRLKGRPEEKPMAFYVASVDDVESLHPDLASPARRVMRELWPGRLTVVVGHGADAPGFRCPDHPIPLAMAEAMSEPWVGTSANRSGEPPLPSAEAISEEFGEELDALIDAGVIEDGRASTVVRIGEDGAVDILREGLIDVETIRAAAAAKILFVCTGNTCRSPMAQMLFEAHGPDATQAISAGLAAFPGSPASEGSRVAMDDRGLDLRAHVARPVTPDLIDRVDHVFTMTKAQRDLVELHFPFARGKVDTLDPDGHDVVDPFGASVAEYRRTAEEIERHVRRRIAETEFA